MCSKRSSLTRLYSASVLSAAAALSPAACAALRRHVDARASDERSDTVDGQADYQVGTIYL